MRIKALPASIAYPGLEAWGTLGVVLLKAAEMAVTFLQVVLVHAKTSAT